MTGTQEKTFLHIENVWYLPRDAAERPRNSIGCVVNNTIRTFWDVYHSSIDRSCRSIVLIVHQARPLSLPTSHTCSLTEPTKHNTMLRIHGWYISHIDQSFLRSTLRFRSHMPKFHKYRTGMAAHLGYSRADNIEHIRSNLVYLTGELVVRVLDLVTKHLGSHKTCWVCLFPSLLLCISTHTAKG